MEAETKSKKQELRGNMTYPSQSHRLFLRGSTWALIKRMNYVEVAVCYLSNNRELYKAIKIRLVNEHYGIFILKAYVKRK